MPSSENSPERKSR
uniref:Uncharacterized protein n=1 Tax=Anguilla anguilla TaxID=7936 RepID=A0A0E9UNU0_ANGAN